MTATVPRPTVGPCCAGTLGTTDPAVQRLRDLIGGGLDQWTASLSVWGQPGDCDPTPTSNLPAWAWLVSLRRFPWLRPGRLGESGAVSAYVLAAVVFVFLAVAALPSLAGWVRGWGW